MRGTGLTTPTFALLALAACARTPEGPRGPRRKRRRSASVSFCPVRRGHEIRPTTTASAAITAGQRMAPLSTRRPTPVAIADERFPRGEKEPRCSTCCTLIRVRLMVRGTASAALHSLSQARTMPTPRASVKAGATQVPHAVGNDPLAKYSAPPQPARSPSPAPHCDAQVRDRPRHQGEGRVSAWRRAYPRV